MQRSGRPTILIQNKIRDISDRTTESPSKSVHRFSQLVATSYGSTSKVLTKHLHLHPYKILSVYELKEYDNEKHVQYSQWFWDLITASGEDILDAMFSTMKPCVVCG
jgi:hypothetical protein